MLRSTTAFAFDNDSRARFSLLASLLARRHNPRRSGSYLIDDDVLPLFLSELRTAMPFLWDPTWIPDAGLVKKKERDSLDGTSARKPVSREGKNTPKNSEKRKVEDSESERKKPKEKKRKEKEPGANAFLETKPKCDCGLLVFAGRVGLARDSKGWLGVGLTLTIAGFRLVAGSTVLDSSSPLSNTLAPSLRRSLACARYSPLPSLCSGRSVRNSQKTPAQTTAASLRGAGKWSRNASTSSG